MNNRKEAYLVTGIRVEMTKDLIKLREKQDALVVKLNNGFDYETYKNLNIINHHIVVAESRRDGNWLKGDYPEIADVVKQR